MLRKLRRSVAHDNLRRMEVKQVNKRKSRGRMYGSTFSCIWKKYDHWIPVAPKRSAKADGLADYNYERS